MPRDTSASDAQVNATVTVADDLSGVAYVGVFLRSPSGAQQRYIYCYPPNPGFLSGTLTGSTIFPRYSEAGTWKVYYIYLGDAVNNAQWINNPAAQGLDATLNVILPSLDTDGSVSSAGGTIEDAVFGSRASITFPPGAVAGDTTAAIDVLTSPLDIPLPSGFAGANTFYVNIHLDPEPNFPLGPPGLTIVLPLTHPMTPGTTLNLYRVNTTTGQLEASLGVDGNPVIGTVDPGGLSATFTGVARLSTVVGLLPDPVITWNNPANIVYGTALSGLQLNASANVPGQFSYTPAAGTVLNAGPNQNLKVTFTPDDAVNYQPVTKTVTISVDKARLKITADNKAKIAGEPLPVFTASFDAFVNGDSPASLSAAPVFSTLATPASPAGNYDINVSGAASDNYDIAYAKGTLTVLASIQLAPVEYSLVSSRRVAATVWEYVYRFKLKNNSPTKAYGVSAQLNTWPTQVTIVDGAVTFGNINAGQTIQSQDTFTIRVDRSKPVRNSDLSWRVTYAYSSGGLFTTSVNLPLK